MPHQYVWSTIRCLCYPPTSCSESPLIEQEKLPQKRLTADVVVCVEGFSPMGGHERQAVNIVLALQQRGRRVALISRRPLSDNNVYVQELNRAGTPIVANGGVRPGASASDWVQTTPARPAEPVAVDREPRVLKAAWGWERRTIERSFLGTPVLHEIPLFGRIPVQGREALTTLRHPVVHTTFGSPLEGMPIPGTQCAVMTTDGSGAGEGSGVKFIPTMAWVGPNSASSPVSRTKPLVMFAGRVVAAKGVYVLLEALRLLRSDVQLRIAGDGPDLDRLRAEASQFEGRIGFLGRLGPVDLASEFAKCRVVAVPSLPSELGSEGVPTVVGEALAAGTRVVASGVGGLPYLEKRLRGRNVLTLVAPGSVEELALALQRAIDSWDAAVPDSARKAYDDVLSPSAVIPQYLEAYEEARSRLNALGDRRP